MSTDKMDNWRGQDSEGILLLEAGAVAKACPLYCLEVDYMTCPSSGDKKLDPKCNCCLAPKGCTLHLSSGTSMLCAKT